VRKYQIKYIAKLTALENKFAKDYRREIKRFNKEAFHSSLISKKVASFIYNDHKKNIYNIITKNDTTTILVFAKLTQEQFVIKAVKKVSVSKSFLDYAQDFIKENALDRSTLIADTSKDRIEKIINDAFEAGDSVDEIAKKITKVDAITFARASIIARTETHRASTYASNEVINSAQENYNLTYLKEWVPTLDARTRPEHAAMAGSKPIAMDDKFYVGGEHLDRPNDIDASPENSINCRCYLEYVLENKA